MNFERLLLKAKEGNADAVLKIFFKKFTNITIR